MTIWAYTAVPLDADRAGTPVSGLLPASAETEARAALRRAGLQPIRLELAGRTAVARFLPTVKLGALETLLANWARNRRTARRAELIDSLATMLEAGVPLPDALATAERAARNATLARALIAIRQMLAEGESFGTALSRHRGWFDTVDCAMVEAGQASGELVKSLRAIAARLERRATVTSRLVAVLTYPAIVFCVGIGVVAFLGTRTLPQLASILTDAGIEVPTLTAAIMTIGSWLVRWGWLVITSLPFLLIAAATMARRSHQAHTLLDRLRPRLIRTLRVAGAARTLADLLSSGVPLVEALRTTSPVAGAGLGTALSNVAKRIEQGHEIGAAFQDERWFDVETIRVLELAQTAGDLAPALSHLAERTERRAERAVASLASILEPALILALATLVGTVVMAAILPLIRLQEVL